MGDSRSDENSYGPGVMREGGAEEGECLREVQQDSHLALSRC